MIKPTNKAFYNAWLFVSKIPILTQNPGLFGRSILLYPGSKDEA